MLLLLDQSGTSKSSRDIAEMRLCQVVQHSVQKLVGRATVVVTCEKEEQVQGIVQVLVKHKVNMRAPDREERK
jgi:hypothetical protein